MIDSARLLVLSDDWGRHPSSCQHLIRCLTAEHDVTWVNTIGMRPPRLDMLTLARAAEKLKQWFLISNTSAEVSCPDRLQVLNPRMWPWMSHRWDRALNARLLARALAQSAKDAIAITTLPIASVLIDRLPVRRWVYYCVDDFSLWPGLAGASLIAQETKLIQGCDLVIAASENLAIPIREQHPNVHVMTHGVDLDFWSRPEAQPSPRWSEIPCPFAVFWGVVDRRMNAEWVLQLADALGEGSVVLAGPQQDPDPRLLAHCRIHLPGPLAIDDLPGLAAQASVLIMPYADLPVTRVMQPLKLKEYLATGCPVVAAPLPALAAWSQHLDLAHNGAEFVAKTLSIMRDPGPRSSQRLAKIRAALERESWGQKAKEFSALAFRN